MENRSLLLTIYTHLGSFGVMLFFVLSGFLIYLSIHNNIKLNKFKSFDVIRYAKSRFIRLYPPLLASSLFIVLLYWLLNLLNLTHSNEFSTGKEIYLARKELYLNPMDMFGSLFFINTIIPEIKTPSLNGPLWSLAHEFWFYVVGGLFVASIYNKRFFILLLAVSLFLYWNVNSFWFYGLIVWIFGFYSAWVYTNKSNNVLKYFNFLLIIVSGVIWAYMLSGSSDSYFMNNRQKFLFGIFFAAILPYLLGKSDEIRKVLHGRFYDGVASMSGYTYTLYLLHFPILLFIFVLTNRVIEGHLGFTILITLLSMVFCIRISSYLGAIIETRSRKRSVVRQR